MCSKSLYNVCVHHLVSMLSTVISRPGAQIGACHYGELVHIFDVCHTYVNIIYVHTHESSQSVPGVCNQCEHSYVLYVCKVCHYYYVDVSFTLRMKSLCRNSNARRMF